MIWGYHYFWKHPYLRSQFHIHLKKSIFEARILGVALECFTALLKWQLENMRFMWVLSVIFVWTGILTAQNFKCINCTGCTHVYYTQTLLWIYLHQHTKLLNCRRIHYTRRMSDRYVSHTVVYRVYVLFTCMILSIL